MGVLFSTRRMVIRGKPEMLTNGDFEDYTGTQDNGVDDDFANWNEACTGAGDLVESTATAHTGSSAAMLTYANDGCLMNQVRAVTPGETYRLTFWARGDGAVDGQYNVYDVTNAANIIAATSTGVTAATYARCTTTFTAPAGCVLIRLFLRSSTVAGVCYYDDVSLRRA